MPTSKQSVLHHENQYSADSACAHCEGVIRHEPWCVTQSADVRYAFQVALYPKCLTLQDSLILHALGVAWNGDKR
jgi:hypothetical protein